MPYLDLIAVEFSVSQKSFHKHTIKEMLARNVENTLRKIKTDYLPVGIFSTHDEADSFIQYSYDTFKETKIET